MALQRMRSIFPVFSHGFAFKSANACLAININCCKFRSKYSSSDGFSALHHTVGEGQGEGAGLG